MKITKDSFPEHHKVERFVAALQPQKSYVKFWLAPLMGGFKQNARFKVLEIKSAPYECSSISADGQYLIKILNNGGCEEWFSVVHFVELRVEKFVNEVNELMGYLAA